MTEREISLTEKLARVSALMHRLHHQMRMEGGFADVHRGQGRVLALLKMKPEINQKDLGFLLDLRAQSLSELLAKLEKNGFIKRSESRDDKRSMDISLTPKGEEAAEKGEESSREDLLPFLNDKEKETLSQIFDKIIAGFQEQMGDAEERGGNTRGGHFFGRPEHGAGDPREFFSRHHGHREIFERFRERGPGRKR